MAFNSFANPSVIRVTYNRAGLLSSTGLIDDGVSDILGAKMASDLVFVEVSPADLVLYLVLYCCFHESGLGREM